MSAIFFGKKGCIMKDTFVSSITAVGAGIVSTLLGGWDKSLEILLIFVVLDYLTGMGAAFKTKTLKSSIGYEGLLKKGTIFFGGHSGDTT